MPLRHVLSGFINQSNFNIHARPAAGTEQVALMILWAQHRHTQRTLSLSVVLPEALLPPYFHRFFDHWARHGRGAINHVAQGRDIGIFEFRMAQQHLEHGGNQVNGSTKTPLAWIREAACSMASLCSTLITFISTFLQIAA